MMTHPLFRIGLFLTTIMLLLYGALWPAVILILVSSLFYNAYEYIFAAFCIDCYFAPEPWALWYTLVVSSIVVGGLLVRPAMRINEPNE